MNKYGDYLPLYRQEQIFARSEYAIAQSTLAQLVGQCGAALQPLVQALCAILLSESVLHADKTPVKMLGSQKGEIKNVYLWVYASTQTSVISMAHVRRKFFELHVANKSLIAEEPLKRFAVLYEIEDSIKTADMSLFWIFPSFPWT